MPSQIVVFDSNVLIPMLLSASHSTRLFHRIDAAGWEVAATPQLLAEVDDKAVFVDWLTQYAGFPVILGADNSLQLPALPGPGPGTGSGGIIIIGPGFRTAFGSILSVAASQDLTFNVGRDQPGVLVDAFHGNGVQTFDLNDLLAFPESDPLILTRPSTLAHGIYEAVQGLSFSYDDAHSDAINDAENSVLQDQDPLHPLRHPDGTTFIPIPSGNFAAIQIAMHEAGDYPLGSSIPTGDLVGYTQLALSSDDVVTLSGIHPGVFNPGAPFSGDPVNISIASVSFIPSQSIPEPSAVVVWLLLATVFISITFVWRTKKASP